MIRRVNFTGRRRIPRSRVRIRMGADGKRRRFDATLDLEGLQLPVAARVFVEAYHRAAYQRFAFGTVGEWIAPADRWLDRIPVQNPLFRVKVVVVGEDGIGRIVAAAEKVVPEAADAGEDGRESLLPVEFEDLGSRVWALDLDADWPRLWLNERLQGVKDLARAGREFATLVYPEVLRQVLERALRDRSADADTGDDGWQSKWLSFARRELGQPQPPRGAEFGDADRQWVERAVDAFCARGKVPQEFERLVAGNDAAEGAR